MASTTDTSTDKRAEYTAGLRALADLLDAHPELPLPDTHSIDWYLFGALGPAIDEQRAEALRIARLLPGKQNKRETGDLFRLVGRIAGMQTQIIVERDAVCRKVVTGTETVEIEEPDPDAVAALPKVKRTETREIVTWECEPILADRVAVTA